MASTRRRRRSAPAPDGSHTLTPRIVARDAEGLVVFLKRVLRFSGRYQENPAPVIEEPAGTPYGDRRCVVANCRAARAAPPRKRSTSPRRAAD